MLGVFSQAHIPPGKVKLEKLVTACRRVSFGSRPDLCDASTLTTECLTELHYTSGVCSTL